MKFSLFGLPLLLAASLHAQEPADKIPAALERAKRELTASQGELTTAREAIAKDKPALAKEYEETALELREKRRLVRIARMSRQDRELELRQLERDRAVRKQDASYLAGLLKDHALKIQTLSGPGEPALAVDQEKLAAEASDAATALTERLGVIDASLDRLEAIFGGSQAPGRAADHNGDVTDGTFASAGPVTWFVSSDGKASGDIIPGKGTAVPKLGDAKVPDIKTLLAGSEATLSLDVTGGNASALKDIDGGPIDLIRKGGLWVWPIMLLALLSLVFGIIKLIEFSRIREPGEAWVNAILAALRVGDREKAKALAADAKHPAAPVMAKLIDASGSTADLVEETLYEQLMGVQSKAGSMLPVIAVTAATSPLLGLLGTVSGMIATFNLITLFGSGDPKPLAGGISEALITTLFGLVVAIPALILHAFLSRRSQGIVQTTERLGLSFVNGLRLK